MSLGRNKVKKGSLAGGEIQIFKFSVSVLRFRDQAEGLRAKKSYGGHLGDSHVKL